VPKPELFRKSSALGYYSANGTRTSAMDIVGDGAHASDPGCNCATPVNPNSVERLSETARLARAEPA